MPGALQIPKRIARKLLFKTVTFNLIRQVLDFGPSRRRIPWYLITHPGAAAVLPILPDGRLVLLCQYRPAIRRWLWEVPCGTMGRGEDPKKCAARELAEEAGYTGRLRRLAAFYSAPGFCTERMFCFTADHLRAAPMNRDPDERIEVHTVRPSQALAKIRDGSIQDAKTLVCLLSYFLNGNAPKRQIRRH